jgi:protein gp37
MADVFEDHPQVIEARLRLFALIDRTPHLDWLLLTKRPENIQRLWPWGWYDEQFTWPNVWLGTSVESQEMADKRIPELLKIPAAVRFLSCEPLLGPVDLFHIGAEDWDVLHGWKAKANNERGWANTSLIDWVIVGGESGPGARQMDLAWAESIVEQCQAAEVSIHVKQLGSVLARRMALKDSKGGDWSQWPEQLRIREYPASKQRLLTL